MFCSAPSFCQAWPCAGENYLSIRIVCLETLVSSFRADEILFIFENIPQRRSKLFLSSIAVTTPCSRKGHHSVMEAAD